MTAQTLGALFCVVLATVRCQPYPRFEFGADFQSNNSYVFRGNIGEGDNALKCVTNNTDCCTDPDVGNWTDERGGAVHQGASGATTIYVTRGDGEVSLNRITGGSSGMWQCDIPDSSGVMQSIYIYTGTQSSGRLTTVSLSFTALHTEPNVSPPEFTLTCQSEGGPATSVIWQRNRVTVEEDSDHETSQIIVDTSGNTVYENRLRVRGREGGDYRCIVNNYIFSGISSLFFTIQVAGEPTNLAAVPQSDTSIEVSWVSPGSPATGYVVYYQPEEGAVSSVTIFGRNTEIHLLESLMCGVIYSISILAQSDHLPSALVGPATARTRLLSIPDGMSFTLDSELNGEVTQFTLTCVSTGVSPTTVTWTRDSERVSGGMTVMDDPVTAQYTHTLTVTGRLGGLYQCTVSNNKCSRAMAGLTVRTVEPPIDILVYQSIPSTLQVSWTPPSPLGHAIGYRIYYDGDDGSSGTLDVSGGMSHSQVLIGLSSSVSYKLSLAALSTHLPSPVVHYGESIPMMPQPSATVDRTRATSVSVNWSGSFGAEHYEVMYERAMGEQQEGHCPSQPHSNLVKVDAPTTSATISGLEEFNTYLITVTARRGKHSFVKSETISLMTSSAGSSAPPRNVMASVQTSTSIFVSWSPITNCSDINGNITGWLVHYSDSNSYTQLIPGSNQESGNTTLVGLLFHTTYWIQVAAINSDGHTGVFSEPIMATTMDNPPPTMSTNIHNATAIEVTWNTTQPAGWNTSHIVHHFTYYTRGHHLIMRLSTDLSWDTASIVVNVKESLHKVEHIFSISSNLIFQEKTYTGLVANISVEFDEAYIQLQFGPVSHCITWTSDQAQQIEEQLKFEIMETLLPKCLMCAGSLIRRGVFLCKSNPIMATYRSTLLNIGIPGLTNASSLVSYVQDWVETGPVVRLDWLLVHINKDCPVAIHQLSDPECPTPHSLQPDLINAVSEVVNTCAMQNLGTQICQNP